MEICINDIVANAIIGCYEHERSNNQKLIINLKVKLYQHDVNPDVKINAIDKLENTIDYDEIIDYVVEMASRTEYQLLESLAQHLTRSMLAYYVLIREIYIEIIKPAIRGVKAGEIKVCYTEERKRHVALALGSNANCLPEQQLISAIELLNEYVHDIKVGGFYRTKPVGFLEQNEFYNTAITGYTSLTPEHMLAKIKMIEKLMGKVETCKNGPRIIDIDIIFFNNLIYKHNFLTIPHEAAHLRDFVLRPLMDIAPNWIHPEFNQTVAQLLSNLSVNKGSILDRLEIKINN